ncbi:MAG TPA: carbohydrate kinase family protein [Streptosporangiaceae bacterium]
MSTLAVLGNISRDQAIYPDGRRFDLLGGAALHLARAAHHAGMACALVSIIGADLDWIRSDPRLTGLDLSHVATREEPSCTFALTYAATGTLASIDCCFGAAKSLTSHCLTALGHHSQYHICSRRPLDVATVLGRLARDGLAFSTDFHLASADELIRAALPFLPLASVVFVNTAEFTTLAALIDPARLAAVVISDGPREATLMRHGHIITAIRPPPAELVEATGAGDTLTGTFLAAQAAGLSDQDALRSAVLAATKAIQAPGLIINRR